MADKVTEGAPLAKSPLRSARFVNNTVDTVNAFVQQRAMGEALGTIGGVTSTDQIRVRNLTGANRLRGDVVQLGNYLLDEVDFRNLWFEGNTVAAPADKKWAILGMPIKENEIGAAFVSGVCVAKVNVSSASHGFAMPAAGDTALHSSSETGPIEILSPLSTTGEQLVAVRLGGGAGGAASSSDCHTIAGFDFHATETRPVVPGRDWGLFVSGDDGCIFRGETTDECCGSSGSG